MSMAILLKRAAMAASVLALLAAMPGGRSAAAPTAQDTADRYNSVDPTVPMKELTTRFSRIVADDLIKAQKEDADMKFDAALADARKAGDAAQTNYEKLKLNQTLTQIYSDLHDTANAAIAAEAAADLPGIPLEERPDVVTNACILATAMHDYGKAAGYARQMQNLKLADDRSKRIIDVALRNEPKP
jgi:hypothetical protein